MITFETKEDFETAVLEIIKRLSLTLYTSCDYSNLNISIKLCHDQTPFSEVDDSTYIKNNDY